MKNDIFRMIDFLIDCNELDLKFRLYILLVTYCKNEKGTSAFNSHFMDRLNINSQRSIQKALRWLKMAKLIDISILRGNKRVITLRNDKKIDNLTDFKNLELDYDWLNN